jgi:hypothetical protein
MERMGIPTMIVTRAGFAQVVANSFTAFGFPPEAPSVMEFPSEMFLPASDLTPLEKNLDQVVFGLTRWKPRACPETDMASSRKVTVTGNDFAEAVSRMELLFLQNLWGDGLPLQPPTQERVDWILRGTDFPRERVIGRIFPRGGVATVEVLAINLAMAGGRPEYLPVLIAAVQAMTLPEYQHGAMNATTCSVYPVLIVNGPIAKQIRLNSGYGCLGPDPRHPAGGSLGRALRLLLMNAGGAIPGAGTMAIYGGPARYTNIVFAEDEDGLAPGWKSLHEERGFLRGANAVTVMDAGGTSNINIIAKLQAPMEQSILNTLEGYAGYMRIPSQNSLFSMSFPDGIGGLLLIPRGVVQEMSKLGWSKEKVRDYLWEKSKIPDSPQLRWEIENRVKTGETPKEWVAYPFPLCRKPEGIVIVVAGGEQSGHSYWMQAGHGGYRAKTQGIQLPAAWEDLLRKAEEDLGPVPDR